MNTIAIILAGGKGTRMGTDIPKQYLPINGRPLLYYTLLAFEHSKVDEIILVAGKDDLEYCQREIVDANELKKVKRIVAGGAERYQSVENGLRLCLEDGCVLVHDGARPCIKPDEINKLIECLEMTKAAILAVPVKDTIKVVQKKDGRQYVTQTPDRSTLWQAQTPQGFRTSVLLEAYSGFHASKDTAITDDAMLVEQFTDYEVAVLMGNYENLKVTTPEDLELAQGILQAFDKK